MATSKEQVGARYKVFGPFPFNEEKGPDDRGALNAFWDALETSDDTRGLADAVGVYIWTHVVDGERLPWNVGLTNKGFRRRFFQKKSAFLQLIVDGRASGIEVYLIAGLTPGGKFRGPTESKTIKSNEWLETHFISSALAVNRNLRNVSKTQKQKRIVVEGFLNDDPLSGGDRAAKSLKKILKVK